MSKAKKVLGECYFEEINEWLLCRLFSKPESHSVLLIKSEILSCIDHEVHQGVMHRAVHIE